MHWSPHISTLFPYTTLFRSKSVAFSTRPLARLVHSPDAVGGRLRRHLSPVAALRRAKRKWQTQRFAPWLFDTRRNTLVGALRDRKSTRLNSSHANTSYAVFC